MLGAYYTGWPYLGQSGQPNDALLSLDNALQSHLSDNIILSPNYVLVTSNASHSQTASAVSLILILGIDNAYHLVQSENIDLIISLLDAPRGEIFRHSPSGFIAEDRPMLV